VQPATGRTSCVACAEGRSKKQTGGTACEACVAGKKAQGTGTAKCEECTFGKYQNVAEATSCKNCASGKFGSVIGANTEVNGCTSCPQGFHQTTVAKIDCTACPAGKKGINIWTLAIASQTITKSAGVEVTQGSKKGVLKKALSGATTNIVVETDDKVTFDATANVVIGDTTVLLANINTVGQAILAADGCLDCGKGKYLDQLGQTQCKKFLCILTYFIFSLTSNFFSFFFSHF